MARAQPPRRAAALRGPTRRGVLAGGLILAAPAVFGQARLKVIVIGGGAGGATAARLMAHAVDVTLIEPNALYRSCFFSNLALGGFVPFDALAHSYDGLRAAGVTIAPLRAESVEPDARRATLSDGARLSYDRLILAPGIDYIEGSVPGWSPADEARIPSAYQTGGNPARIREQVLALREGGTWCLIAPPDPSRCPPAPYERVSMVAGLLKRRNPTAKILIIDPKEGYAKQALFEEGWQAHYPGMIDRLGPDFGGDIVELRPDAMEVIVDGEVEAFDACNVIPAQKAGAIAQLAGVVDGSGWAPVEPLAMRSTLQPGVHVIGDAAAPGGIPKSASGAVSEAKIAAAAILAELTGSAPPEPRYSSACWSAISAQDSVVEATTYLPGEGTLKAAEHVISQTSESPETRAANWSNAFTWYSNITAEIFG